MTVRIVVLVGILLMLAVLAGFIGAEVAKSANCTRLGTGQMSAPSNVCTPGEYRRLSRAAACTPKEREYIPVAVRRRILARYGLPTTLPYSGKFDHRISHVFGGTDSIANVWPAPERVFLKDRLEYALWRRVCRGEPYRMRVQTAVRALLADWRAAFRYYVQHRGEQPR